jgi:prefoldin subunit 5
MRNPFRRTNPEVAALRDEIAELRALIESVESEISPLEDRVRHVERTGPDEDDFARLDERVNEMASDITDMQAEIADLSKPGISYGSE